MPSTPSWPLMGAVLLAIGLGPALAAEVDPVVQRAFDRADAAAADFAPYRFHLETHTRLSNGDEQLEHEERAWADAIQWSPDSTEILTEGKELVFSKDEDGKDADEEMDAEAKDDKEDHRLDVSYDFFEAGRRDEYRFVAQGRETREGREFAVLELRPRVKKKGLWKGRLWLDPATGALCHAELEPAKGRFGVKRWRVDAALEDYRGLDLPRQVDMDLEIKVPLLVHEKIRVALSMSEIGAATD